MTTDQKSFNEWAIVDVMGHQRYVGLVSEYVIAGCGFVHVQVPETESQPAWSKMIGTASIYAITPVSESVARQLAESRQSAPVQPYEMPKAITAMNVEEDDVEDLY